MKGLKGCSSVMVGLKVVQQGYGGFGGDAVTLEVVRQILEVMRHIFKVMQHVLKGCVSGIENLEVVRQWLRVWR